MNKLTQLIFTLFLIVYLIAEQAIAATLPCENVLAKAAIPQDAYFLPEDQASQLQSALDKYRKVRLKPAGNYKKSNSIKLRSNQELYGLADTGLREVIIPAGTTNAILSGIRADKPIIFEGGFIGTQSIRNNCFNRITKTTLEMVNSKVENNFFSDLSFIGLNINTRKEGYFKNNRFLRIVTGGQFKVSILGDSTRQSDGNEFIFTNTLLSFGESINVDNQNTINFIGLDAESWNYKNEATLPAMMNVSNTNNISLFLATGGDNVNRRGRFFNLDAKNIVLQYGDIGQSNNKYGVSLGVKVENFLNIYSNIATVGVEKLNKNTNLIDLSSSLNQLRPSLRIPNTVLVTSKPNSTEMGITKNLMNSQKNMFNDWVKPIFEPIPDPAGSSWQTNLSKQLDSTNTIQSLINKNGIAELKAGKYYISRPLIINRGQGIIGAGDNKTVIIAKSPSIDLIAPRSNLNARINSYTDFVLADLTLQGGLNGINTSASGSGRGADYHRVTLSHVTFRNMTNSGILIDGIYAWDNNYIDYTNFYKCKTGIKQRPDLSNSGNNLGITFLDKNVFYGAQFIDNSVAVDWKAGRANNLNAFVNSNFKNNDLTLDLFNNRTTLSVNSVFETNSGKSIIQNNLISSFVNSYFKGGSSGTNTIFNGNVFCNNCKIDNSSRLDGLITPPTSKFSFFTNSELTKPTRQTLSCGLIVNSNFSTTPSLNENSLSILGKRYDF